MRKKNKKSQVSIQFNWILVLIIGAIILTFFLSIVQKQKTFSEESISATVQTDLQAIFSSSAISTGTASIIELPNREVGFSCEGFKIGNQFASNFPYAFSPDLLKSNRATLSVYAYDWSIPYKVTNFLYVTSPDIKYYFVISDESLKAKLKELLPPSFITKDGQSKLFLNNEFLEDKPDSKPESNNYKVRIVYFTDFDVNIAPKFGKTKNKDVTALVIDDSSIESGEIKFYKRTDPNRWYYTGSSQLAGKASFLAAVYAENKDIYDCGMNNSLQRLKAVTEIYINRTKSLDTNDDSPCKNDYSNPSDSSALDTLNDIKNQNNIQSLISLSTTLKSQNNALLTKSCPSIY
jgi:hypothetical protein